MLVEDFVKKVSERLSQEASAIQSSLVQGMAGTLEQYKSQAGILRGITFAAETMKKVLDDSIND